MLGHLWRQNIYLASATLEKSPSLSWVLSVEVLEGMPWGGAVGQSWRAAAVLIFDLACKHSHSRLARGAGCCCLPCQHTGADIFPIGSFSAVRVIFPLACFLFYLLSPDLPHLACIIFFFSFGLSVPLDLNSFFDSKWIFLINRKSSSSSTIYIKPTLARMSLVPLLLSFLLLLLFFTLSLSHHPLLALPLLL